MHTPTHRLTEYPPSLTNRKTDIARTYNVYPDVYRWFLGSDSSHMTSLTWRHWLKVTRHMSWALKVCSQRLLGLNPTWLRLELTCVEAKLCQPKPRCFAQSAALSRRLQPISVFDVVKVRCSNVSRVHNHRTAGLCLYFHIYTAEINHVARG